MKKPLTFTGWVLLCSILFFSFLHSCKKVDIERIAAVKSGNITNISTSSARATGEIIDMGEGVVNSYGFVYGTNSNPDVNDSKISLGQSPPLGSYSGTLGNLSANTSYWARGYIEVDGQVTYGESTPFKTLQGTIAEWLHWDNGQNNDGIGRTDGGSFDVAIGFIPAQLAQYDGYQITKIRIFPKEYITAEFSIEIFEGHDLDNMTLQHLQSIPSPAAEQWNEIQLDQPYTIDASQRLLVGYWVFDQSPGYYPAGIDDGPAETGSGDLISFDDGTTWDALSEIISIEGNWNIQIWVTNQKGKEFKLSQVAKKPGTDASIPASTSHRIASFNSNL
jgi:hypothetical protein